MEEILKFYRVLLRYRLALLSVPVITVIIAFFLVRNLPDVYTSQAQLSTGIVDQTQQSLLPGADILQESRVNQEFSNMLQMMQLEKIVNQVSYKLILHDLTASHPFRPHSRLFNELNEDAKKHAREVYLQKYEKREGLDLWNKDQQGLYRLLESMKYDQGSIKQKLRTYRLGTSDFIYVEFDSENPGLSAFVVNALSSEFVKYYSELVKENELKSVTFLKNLLQEKYTDMNDKVEKLRLYKIQNRVLNLNEQSSQLYTQILDYSNRKQEAIKDIASYQGAINNIDHKFSPSDRRYLESAMTGLNQEILYSKQNLQSLYDRYIDNDFDESYKNSIDSMKDVLGNQISLLSDKYIVNPLNTRQELVQQKLNLQVQLDLARYSIGSLNRQIAELNKEFDELVPHEAVVQSLERDIDVASKEYLDVLNKYNQVSMQSDFSVKIKLVQQAMPGFPQPSKKMLLIILSYIISIIFCVFVIFIIFWFDHSVADPAELAQTTNLPVLGFLSLFSEFSPYPGEKEVYNKPELVKLKHQLRALRFEIGRELKEDDKVIAFTSLSPLEGKTFSILGLAYSYSMINKKVLIIDGNFSDPAVTEITGPKAFLEDWLNGDQGIISSGPVTVLGNRGSEKSLLELSSSGNIRNLFDGIKSRFDLILVETSALNTESYAREWFIFADKLCAVFEAGLSIKDRDKQYIEYFRSVENKFMGWIFNKMITGKIKRKKAKNPKQDE